MYIPVNYGSLIAVNCLMYIPVNNGQTNPSIRENAAVCQINDIGYIL